MATELNPFSCESVSGNKQSLRLWDWLNICRDAFYRLLLAVAHAWTASRNPAWIWGCLLSRPKTSPKREKAVISCLSIPGGDDGGQTRIQYCTRVQNQAEGKFFKHVGRRQSCPFLRRIIPNVIHKATIPHERESGCSNKIFWLLC